MMKRVFDDKRYTNEGVHTFLNDEGNLVMVYEEGTPPYNTGYHNKEVLLRARGLRRNITRYVIKEGTMGEFLANVTKEPSLIEEVIL